MRIHVIIHASFEAAGVIESWAIGYGHHLTSTHTYRGEKLPDVSAFDFLVIMGGPQSPLELDKYPYLHGEMVLTRQAIDQNKAVLGVCLGAQIIAESLGAKTEHSPNTEIGVYPIHLTNEALNDPIFKSFPKSFDVMHWHNDMPGIVHDGVLLAYSDGCPRQVFRYGDRVYGFQCHMQMTADLVKDMTVHCSEDLKPGKYIQKEEKLLSNDMAEMNKKMIYVLDYLAELISVKQAVKSTIA